MNVDVDIIQAEIAYRQEKVINEFSRSGQAPDTTRDQESTRPAQAATRRLRLA